jgi:hypothetical protein
MKRASFVWSCCAVLLLSACRGEDDGNPTPGPGPGPNPTPTTITVTGKVLDGSRKAATKASILIPGEGRQAVSVDSSGAFSIAGVTPPYDVIVVEKELRVASVFQGLTLQNLTLPVDSDPAQEAEILADVKGTVTGGQTPSDTYQTVVTFSSENSSSTGPADLSGAYSLGVSWTSAPSITGTLYALQAERSDIFDVPTSYLAFGQRENVTLNENVKLSAQDITMSSVTNSSLAGNITVPAGYTLGPISVSLAPKPATEISLFYDIAASNAFTYTVPQIPQATFTMQVITSVPNPADPFNTPSSILFKRGLTAGTTNLALALPEASRPALPANEAKDVTQATLFSWSSFANGLHMIKFTEVKDESPYTVALYTKGTQTTLPDLSALGMGLPASTQFTWKVQGVGAVTSMDALAGLLESGTNFPDLEEYSVSLSESRTFTTAATP